MNGFFWGAGGLLVIILVAFFVVIPLWGTIDAALRPDSAWREADQNKLLWVALQIFLWGFGSIAYLIAIRPKLRDVEPSRPPKPPSTAALVILAASLALLVGGNTVGRLALRHTRGQELSLDRAVQYARTGRISEATFLEDEHIAVLTVHGERAPTPRYVALPDQALGPLLDAAAEHGVAVTIDQQRARAAARTVTSVVLPALIAMNALMLILAGARHVRRRPTGTFVPSAAR